MFDYQGFVNSTKLYYQVATALMIFTILGISVFVSLMPPYYEVFLAIIIVLTLVTLLRAISYKRAAHREINHRIKDFRFILQSINLTADGEVISLTHLQAAKESIVRSSFSNDWVELFKTADDIAVNFNNYSSSGSLKKQLGKLRLQAQAIKDKHQKDLQELQKLSLFS